MKLSLRWAADDAGMAAALEGIDVLLLMVDASECTHMRMICCWRRQSDSAEKRFWR